MRASAILLALGSLSLLASCDTAATANDAGGGDAASVWLEGRVVPIDVPVTSLEAGGETIDLCYSLTLGNDVPVYVSSVSMTATEGVHHSNWFYVPERLYRGDDGLWPCADRGFDTAIAAATGGVLFAQSTQALEETMAFGPGEALALPVNARVVVNLHYVNYSGAALSPTMSLAVTTIPEAEVVTRLHGFAFSYNDLAIPARSEAEFSTECDLNAQHLVSFERPLDFGIRYVLPHYHALGTYLSLEVVGGPRDGAVIWEAASPIGEPLGGRPDPAFDLTGATGIRLTCRFANPGDTAVGWGNADGEMCIAFGYSDSPNLWSNFANENTVTGVVGGVTMNTSPCTVITATPSTR